MEHTYRTAHCERISGIAITASANRRVVVYATFSISTTYVCGARIYTFLIYTRLIKGAFRWYDTLGPTSRSASNETRQTRTDRNTIIVLWIALGVWTTRARTTCINGLVLNSLWNEPKYKGLHCDKAKQRDSITQRTYDFQGSKSNIDRNRRYIRHDTRKLASD